VILLFPLYGATASWETHFVLAAQQLRELVRHGVSYERVISPDILARLKSDVLPYLSQEFIKVSHSLSLPYIFRFTDHTYLLLAYVTHYSHYPNNLIPISLSYLQTKHPHF